ncbi:hypothetical protein DINM_002098 [Dirofilaria immitis]|nr:hypothetical protein [Dirofilaria immitis]
MSLYIFKEQNGINLEQNNAEGWEKLAETLAGQNHTWFHLIVSIHAISALSLCIFTVLGYVANTIPMALVVLFIFQTFMAILGLTAIEQNRRDYRSLYIAINAVTAGSAIIWSIFLFINIKQQPKYVPVVLLIIAFFSSQEQRKDSSEIKTGASVTESLEQRQGISETKSEEGNKELRIAAGAEDASKVITAVETIRGHYLVVDSNWHEFYSVPILNACNVALCSSSRTGGHLRNKFLIKKCRKKQ